MENPGTSNSPEFLKQVQLAIDGALRPDEQTAFFKQINDCPFCLEKYYKERRFKQFLENKVVKKCVSDDLISRIKSNLDRTPPQ